MIAMDALLASLSQLSGEAVKVALVLMTQPSDITEIVADLSWRTRTGRELFLHTKIVERSLKELAETGLCEMCRTTLKRVPGSSMSEGTPSLARTSSVMSEAKNGEAGSEATWRGGESQRLDESAQPSLLQLPQQLEAASTRARGARRGRHASDLPLSDSADVQACIARFDELYREINGGARPTWGGRQYVMMKQLVDKHGRAEVSKRIEIMFKAPPRWPAPPYDLQTLAMHFDKFATPSGKGGMIDRWASGETYSGASEPKDGGP